MFLPVHKLAKQYKNLQSRVEKAKEKTEEATGEVMKLAVVGGGSAAISYANARYGKQPQNTPAGANPLFEVQIFGMPADLAAGALLEVGAFAGVFGRQADVGYNLALAALTSYGCRKATLLGQHALTQKNVQNVQGPGTTAGALGYGPYSSYQGTRQNQPVSAGVG